MNSAAAQGADTLTPRQLAERLGFKPHYGHQLAREGRFVFAPGSRKLVLVAESMARFEATKDPSKAGVAARHADQREAAALPPPAGLPPPGTGADGGADLGAGYNYQDSKAKREHFAALEAEASYRQKIHELLDGAEVRTVLAEILTVLRSAIEGIPYRMAPVLAATSDEAQVKSILFAEIEAALKDASGALARLGRGEA